MRQPSMASVLGAVVGPYGAVFISIGLIVSVLGAYLAWSLICIEVVFAAAKTGELPRFLAAENKNKVPSAALWLTNGVIQIFLITTLLSDDAFTVLLKLTSAMVLVPYLLVAGYSLSLGTWRRKTDGTQPQWRASDIVISTLATLYAIFMIYAADIKFLLLAAILYAPGTLLYIWARRERKLPIFYPLEFVLFAVIAAGAIVGLAALATGYIVI